MVNNAIKYNKNNLRSMLIHGEGAAIAASLVTDAKYRAEVLPFKEWRGDFIGQFNEMRASDGETINSYQEQLNEIIEKFGSGEDAFTDSSEYKILVDRARGTGVSQRWDYERFFAENSSQETHSGVLGAYQSDGSYRHWTAEELDIIERGGRVAAPIGENLERRITHEGHHGMDVSSLDADDIEMMYDPEGIRIMTPRGHLEVGHGGSWSNPSETPYTEITDRSEAIVTGERDYYSNRANTDVLIGISMGLLYGSISAIIRYRQLMKDPLPWNRQKAIVITGAFLSGAATGTIPYLVIQQIHNPMRENIEGTLSSMLNDGELLIQDSFADSLADATGSFVLIMSAITIRTVMQGGLQLHQRGTVEAFKQMGGTLRRSTIEQTGFFALQLVLDNVTPLPDATLSIVVTSSRVLYGFGKIGLYYKQAEELDQENINAIYDAAYGVLLK